MVEWGEEGSGQGLTKMSCAERSYLRTYDLTPQVKYISGGGGSGTHVISKNVRGMPGVKTLCGNGEKE